MVFRYGVVLVTKDFLPVGWFTLGGGVTLMIAG